IGGGYTHVVPDEGTSKNGYHLLLTGFSDIGTENWVWQLGGGFFYNRLYSDGEKNFAGSQPNTVREQTRLRIETRAGEAELGLRRRLGLGFEGGLLLRGLFGSSLSFSQDKDSKSVKFFLGPQLVLRLNKNADWT